VLDRIFDNLVDCRGDAFSTIAHSILGCRRVNPDWKSAAEKVMGAATVSALEPELRGRSDQDQDRVYTIHSLIPTLYTGSKYTLVENIWCPNFLKKVASNPFPLKALQISGVEGNGTFSTTEYSRMPLLKLLTGWDIGHNLTSFILCNQFRISPYVLKLLLQQMPNLKVLDIQGGFLSLDDDDVNWEVNQFKLPPLNQLQVLKVVDNKFLLESDKDDDEDSSPGGSTWILNSYLGSPTLTHLEFGEIVNNLCLSLENFPCLKSLEWWGEKEDTFSNFESLPLEQLSINNGVRTSFEVFADFLNKFSSTLVHLELLGVPMKDLESNGFNFGKKIACNFPNLKFFSWDYPLNQQAMQALAFYFLPRFPALEKLELTEFSMQYGNNLESEQNHGVPHHQRDEQEIMGFLERENYWGVCKNLKSIHVFPRFQPEHAIYVAYRIQEVEAKVAN